MSIPLIVTGKWHKRVIVDATWDMRLANCRPHGQGRSKDKISLVNGSSTMSKLTIEQVPMKKETSPISPGSYLLDFELLLNDFLPETLYVGRKHTCYFLQALVEPSRGTGCKIQQSREITVVNFPNHFLLDNMVPTCVLGWKTSGISIQVSIGSKSAPLNGHLAIIMDIKATAEIRRFEVKVTIVELIYKFKKSGLSSISDESRQVLFERAGNLSKFRAPTGRSNSVIEGMLRYPTTPMTEMGKFKEFKNSNNPLDSLLDGPDGWANEFEFSIRMPACGAHNHGHPNPRMHFDICDKEMDIKHRIEVRFHLNVSKFSKSSFEANIVQFRVGYILCSPSGQRYSRTLTDDVPFLLRSCYLDDSNIWVPPYPQRSR